MPNQKTFEDLGPRVPAICEHPGCAVEVTRGRVNTCGTDPAGGAGCGLIFCGAHLQGPGQTCEQCAAGKPPYKRKTTRPDWTDFKLTGDAWALWRQNNPDLVMALAGKKGKEMRDKHAAKAAQEAGKPDTKKEPR